MSLEEKMKKLQMRVLQTADDTSLTTNELRRKYNAAAADAAVGRAPSPPMARSASSSVHARHTQPLTPGQETLRCFACDSLLRNPPSPLFACCECGAFNQVPGAESPPPPPPRGFAQLLLERHPRTAAAAGAAAICVLLSRTLRWLLAVIAVSSAPGRHSLWQSVLLVVLAVGAAFNFVAAAFVGPGFVTRELNPLRNGELSKPTAAPSSRVDVNGAGADADAAARSTIASNPGQSCWQHGGGLQKLIAQRGEAPLRAWRWCDAAGLSMPPRAAYCGMCRAVVLRAEYHSTATGCCIGVRNFHYYFTALVYATALSLHIAITCVQIILRPGGGLMPSQLSGNSTALLIPYPAETAAAAGGEKRGAQDALLGALAVIAATAAVALGKWVCVHLSNLRQGVTYPESLQSPPPVEHNQGFRRNAQNIFGATSWQLLSQLLPVPRAALGDGIRFPSRRASLNVAQSLV